MLENPARTGSNGAKWPGGQAPARDDADGDAIRAVHELLGHKDVRTTRSPPSPTPQPPRRAPLDRRPARQPAEVRQKRFTMQDRALQHSNYLRQFGLRKSAACALVRKLAVYR